MARYYCNISGLWFQTDHFSFQLPKGSGYFHPVFAMSQKELMILAQSAPVFSKQERYMHFIALLHSTEAVRWTCSARYTDRSASTAAMYWEKMLKTVGRINSINHPSFQIPHIRIQPDNCELQSVSAWIDATESAFEEWYDSYKSVAITGKLARRKEVLERWIKDPQKDIKAFGYILADWASMALQFPNGKLRARGGITVNEYWKQIIVACATEMDIFTVDSTDLNALIEYCETNLEMGNIYSHALMQHLYEGKRKKSNFLGSGDVDMEGTYRILEVGTSIEIANKIAIIEAAPTEIPVPSNYPNKLAYLKAKLRWDMASKHKAEQQLFDLGLHTTPVPPVSAVSALPNLSTSFGEL